MQTTHEAKLSLALSDYLKKHYFNVSTLTNHSANCLNRDDSNMAKSMIFGGSRRILSTSQCWKSNIRNGEVYDELFKDGKILNGIDKSIRTFSGEKLASYLEGIPEFTEELERRLREDDAMLEAFAEHVGKRFDAEAKALLLRFAVRLEAGKTNVLIAWNVDEIIAATKCVFAEVASGKLEMEMVKKCVEAPYGTDGDSDSGESEETATEEGEDESAEDSGSGSKKKGKKGKKEAHPLASYWKDNKKKLNGIRERVSKELEKHLVSNIDTAMSGRMCTGGMLSSVEGALSCGGEFTTHSAPGQSDWFTAMDDLGGDTAGAGHINLKDFGTGTYFGHDVIDANLFFKNRGMHLKKEDELREFREKESINIAKYLLARLQSTLKGKQNSYASYSYPEYVLVTFGSRPLSLESAYESPAKNNNGEGFFPDSVRRLEDLWLRLRDGFDYRNDDVAVFTVRPETSELVDMEGVVVCKSVKELAEWMASKAVSM